MRPRPANAAQEVLPLRVRLCPRNNALLIESLRHAFGSPDCRYKSDGHGNWHRNGGPFIPANPHRRKVKTAGREHCAVVDCKCAQEFHDCRQFALAPKLKRPDHATANG